MSNRFRKLLFCLALGLLILAVAYLSMPPGTIFDQIKPGMTEEEVIAILGPCSQVSYQGRHGHVYGEKPPLGQDGKFEQWYDMSWSIPPGRPYEFKVLFTDDGIVTSVGLHEPPNAWERFNRYLGRFF